MLLIVVFSFNRAMQLDCLLKSIYKRLRINSFKIVVIYHTTGKHTLGYAKLRDKYKYEDTIAFYERKNHNRFLTDILPHLLCLRNLYHYFKHSYLRRKRDNFKVLTEKVIKESNCEFVMFSTDDQYLCEDTFIPDEVFEFIKKDPYQVSYRIYVGNNLEDAPPELKRQGNLLSWDYYDRAMIRHWAYPFAVDGTVYSSKALLNVIKKVLYHMPTTLEAFTVTYCRSKKLFRRGYSPLKSTMVGLFINKVQTICNNLSGDISPDLLNSKFLEGYALKYEFPIPVKDQALIPQKLILSRGEEFIDLMS